MKKWEVSEKNEAMRDELRYRDMPSSLVKMYIDALVSLEKEGNPRAKIVMEMFKTNDDRGFHDVSLNRREWAYNIHSNTWSETSFAGVVKARVLVIRIQKGSNGTSSK